MSPGKPSVDSAGRQARQNNLGITAWAQFVLDCDSRYRFAKVLTPKMTFSELADLYSEANLTRFLIAASILVAVIAFTHRIILPTADLGFLYIFPILIAAGFLKRWQ